MTDPNLVNLAIFGASSVALLLWLGIVRKHIE
jgi:hypothetical protein